MKERKGKGFFSFDSTEEKKNEKSPFFKKIISFFNFYKY